MLEFLNDMPKWVLSIIALSGGVCGLVGAILSIVNFRIILNERKVHLQVYPFLAFNGAEGSFCMSSHRPERIDELLGRGLQPVVGLEIINLSKFPVTIDEVGFCYTSPQKGERSVFINPLVLPSKENLPFRIASRDSVKIYNGVEVIPYIHQGMETAYAMTGCNTVKTVLSKQFIQNIKYTVSNIDKQ